MIVKTFAFARAGLLGNPSDGYFGKTISIIVKNFAAMVMLYESPELKIEPCPEDINRYKNINDLVDSINENGYYGATRLIKASIKKFYQYIRDNSIKFNNKNFTIQYHSTIPRQVGLAGSSAIVTATIKALMKFYDVKIPLEILPTLVLSVERDELGITAGLQDRVIQCYEGCVYMDFNKEYLEKNGHGIYEKIDVKLLPNIYIAYKTELSKVSGSVLNNIRLRYEQGDKTVIDTLNQIANVAEEGKKAILKKDYQRLHELINMNFDLRCKIMNISESNREMIEVARSCGASAKFAGSGGSIIGTYSNDDILTKLIVELKKIKVRVIKPFIS